MPFHCSVILCHGLTLMTSALTCFVQLSASFPTVSCDLILVTYVLYLKLLSSNFKKSQ